MNAISDDALKEMIVTQHTTAQIKAAARRLGVILGYDAAQKCSAAGAIVSWARHNDVPCSVVLGAFKGDIDG